MRARPVRHLRWWIIATICLLTVINYIDRQTLSVLAPTIMGEFGMTNVDYSRVVTAFLLAYTVSQAVSGKILDRIGTRRGFMLFVGVWTAASMLHATARSFVQLAAFRFLLGLGEAGNWPGAAKVVAEWFPARERAFAMALFNSGAVIGAVVAPPLIAWVALTFGWRAAFFIGASCSVVVMALWWANYHVPQEHPRLSTSERLHITSDQPAPVTEAPRPWLSLFRHRQTWALVVGRFFTDPIWWFLISWLPNYLKSERGFSLALIGLLAWIPFLFADVGNLVGGGTSSLLLRRGWSVDRARKLVMLAHISLAPLGVLLLLGTRSDAAALTAISLIAFGFQGWIVNVLTLPSDCFPRADVGAVAGIGGAAAGTASMAFTLLVGWVVDHYSYQPVFVMVAVMACVGAVGWLTIMRTIERVPAYGPAGGVSPAGAWHETLQAGGEHGCAGGVSAQHGVHSAHRWSPSRTAPPMYVPASFRHAALTFTLLALPAILPAQATLPVRIGIIDSRVLLQEMPGRAHAESEFALENAKARELVRTATDSLKRAIDELTRAEGELRPQQREAAVMVIRARELALEDMVSQLNLLVQHRLQELQAPLRQRMQAAIRAVRTREKLGLVIDLAAGSSVIDADETLNIMPQVLAELRTMPAATPTSPE